MFLDIFTPHNCARLSVWKLISRAGKLFEYLFELEHSLTILCVFFSFHTIVQGLACAIVWVQMFWVIPSKLRRSWSTLISGQWSQAINSTTLVWVHLVHFHLFPQATCVVWALQLNIQYTSIANYGDIVEANCYVHCDNWQIDLDEHVHSSFVRSWRRPMWPKRSAISCYCLIDSAMYVLIKVYSPVHYGLCTLVYTVVYWLL